MKWKHLQPLFDSTPWSEIRSFYWRLTQKSVLGRLRVIILSLDRGSEARYAYALPMYRSASNPKNSYTMLLNYATSVYWLELVVGFAAGCSNDEDIFQITPDFLFGLHSGPRNLTRL